MNVTKWGPGAWVYLHTITFNYPLNPTNFDKKRYADFFNLNELMLPCKYCRQSYEVYIKFMPIEPFLESREGVTYWLYRLHDLINKKLFTKSPSFEEVVAKYEKIRAGCSKMIKDGDTDKKFNSCQLKVMSNEELIREFSYNAIASYKKKIDGMAEKLYASPENPNKECQKYYNKKNNDKVTLPETNSINNQPVSYVISYNNKN
jgi:hypothetical protein